MKKILILFLFIFKSFHFAFGFIDLDSILPNSTLEITINTDLRVLGGQKLLLSLKTGGDEYEYILNASTGNEGYPTPGFIGHPIDLKETFTISPFNYEYQDAVFYSEKYCLYSMPLNQFHTSNEGQRSSADCLTEGLACTRGSIGLWPNDAKLIFDIVQKLGLKNTVININNYSAF